MTFHPISPGIAEKKFISFYDKTPQTYLLKDFRENITDSCPLLIIGLHGARSHQEQAMTAKIYGNAFSRLAVYLEKQKAVYVCPEYRGNSWMGAAAEQDMTTMLEQLKAQFNPQKTILFGGSMGGTSTLIYAARNPEKLDGILAMCPATDTSEFFNENEQFRPDFIESYGGTPHEKPTEYYQRSSRNFIQNLASLPLVLVHGTADAVIPFHHSRILAEKLKSVGAHFEFRVIENGNHDSPLSIPLGELLEGMCP